MGSILAMVHIQGPRFGPIIYSIQAIKREKMAIMIIYVGPFGGILTNGPGSKLVLHGHNMRPIVWCKFEHFWFDKIMLNCDNFSQESVF